MKAKEYELVQNVALASVTFRRFAKEFTEAAKTESGPTLLHFLPVLPIVFHEETSISIYSRRKIGGLENALIDNRALFVGLQKRMEDMHEQTLAALNISCATNLLSYDRVLHQFFPGRRVGAPSLNNQEGKRISSAAGRLGLWFAELSLPEITHKLSIHF